MPDPARPAGTANDGTLPGDRTRLVHTHCMICEQLCGLAVTVEDGRIAAIRPDRDNPYTWRDFCVKAQSAHEVVEHPLRLRSPMRKVAGKFEPASYEEAIADIAARLRAIVDASGPDAVAGYSGNPQGFSFAASAFHAGLLAAIGTHQKFSVQSIDSNAKHVAAGAMFGHEMLALVPDIDAADCVVLVGTNPAVSKFNWGGKVPNGWRRLKDRVREGATLVVVDPRQTETARHATLHLSPRPETDWALLLGMAGVILDEGLERLPDGVRIDGFDALRRLAVETPLSALAGYCDVAAEAIAEAARSFAAAPRGFVFAGTGPALGRHGVLAQWLALALNVLTDRIDRPGGRFMPAWPTDATKQAVRGQAARRTSGTPGRVRGLKPVAGNHALAELADEILTPGEGQVRALFIGGGNPVSTGPDGARLAEALRRLDLLVCVDLFQRESHADADWLIPAVHFLEREEIHVPLHAYNDRPFIQSARQVVPPPAGVWPEWRFYRELAAALGREAFGGTIRDPDDLARTMLGRDGPVTVETVRAAEHGLLYGERTMGHLLDVLREEDIAIDLCPEPFAGECRAALASLDAGNEGFRVISRRRNGMMNSALANVCAAGMPDATTDTVEINRADALSLGIAEGTRVTLTSATSAIEATATLSDDIRRGTLVLAHGWGSALLDPARGAIAACTGQMRNRLVGDADLDPLSAVPRLNGTPVFLAAAPTGEPA